MRLAESAACVLALREEAITQHAVTQESVDANCVEVFAQGDVNLDVEIQTAVHEKDPGFTVLSVSALSALIKLRQTDVDRETPESHTVQVKAAELDQTEFDLEMAKLDFDRTSYTVWRR